MTLDNCTAWQKSLIVSCFHSALGKVSHKSIDFLNFKGQETPGQPISSLCIEARTKDVSVCESTEVATAIFPSFNREVI